MNTGRYVLSQILDLVHWQTLSRLVERYGAEWTRSRTLISKGHALLMPTWMQECKNLLRIGANPSLDFGGWVM